MSGCCTGQSAAALTVKLATWKSTFKPQAPTRCKSFLQPPPTVRRIRYQHRTLHPTPARFSPAFPVSCETKPKRGRVNLGPTTDGKFRSGCLGGLVLVPPSATGIAGAHPSEKPRQPRQRGTGGVVLRGKARTADATTTRRDKSCRNVCSSSSQDNTARRHGRRDKKQATV